MAPRLRRAVNRLLPVAARALLVAASLLAAATTGAGCRSRRRPLPTAVGDCIRIGQRLGAASALLEADVGLLARREVSADELAGGARRIRETLDGLRSERPADAGIRRRWDEALTGLGQVATQLDAMAAAARSSDAKGADAARRAASAAHTAHLHFIERITERCKTLPDET